MDAELAEIAFNNNLLSWREYMLRATDVRKLRTAIDLDDPRALETFIGDGGDINATDEVGWTLLQHAAARNNSEAVARLLARGADPNTRDGLGWRPLHRAALYGFTEIALYLIQSGADIEARDGSHQATPLFQAVSREHDGIATLLVDRGANVEAEHLRGETPLALAARRNPGLAAYMMRRAQIGRASAPSREPKPR